MTGGGVGTVGGGGTVTQPARMAVVAAANAMGGTRHRTRDRGAMVWLLLEVLLALVIAVAIVVWTMGPRRKKARRDLPDDAGPGGKR